MRRQEFAVVALATAFALAAPPAWAQRPGGTPAGTAEPRGGGGGESGGGGGAAAVPRGGDSGGGQRRWELWKFLLHFFESSSSAPASVLYSQRPFCRSTCRTRRSVVAVVTAAAEQRRMAAAETAAARPRRSPRVERRRRRGRDHAADPAVHRRPRARQPGRDSNGDQPCRADLQPSARRPSAGRRSRRRGPGRGREPATAGTASLATTTATIHTASGYRQLRLRARVLLRSVLEPVRLWIRRVRRRLRLWRRVRVRRRLRYGDRYYGGGGSGSYSREPRDAGSLRLKIKPREAQVYVDGYLVGDVDSFDGAFQKLGIESGGAQGRAQGGRLRAAAVRRADHAG